MDGKEFWNKIDLLLSAKNMSLVSLSKQTGIPLSTIYRQRERHQLPKMKEFKAIESLLDVWLDESNKNITLSEHECELVLAYRNHPEFQIAIDTMLGLQKKSGESTSKVG